LGWLGGAEKYSPLSENFFLRPVRNFLFKISSRGLWEKSQARQASGPGSRDGSAGLPGDSRAGGPAKKVLGLSGNPGQLRGKGVLLFDVQNNSPVIFNAPPGGGAFFISLKNLCRAAGKVSVWRGKRVSD
jgi:hypothetical protein